MTGLEIRAPAGFAEVFSPLRDEFSGLYWHLDLVAGPFTPLDGTELDDYDALDRMSERCSVDFEALGEGLPVLHGSLWRPGTLPRYAENLWEDEWGYFHGITASSDVDAWRRAASVEMPLSATPGSLGRIPNTVRIVLVEVEYGLWHVVSRQKPWVDRLARHHPEARRVPVDEIFG